MVKNRFNSVLDSIERVGNKLPHPATLFFLMAVIVAIISAIGAGLNLSAIHPATGETIEAQSLLSVEGIQWIRLMYCYEDKITDELIEVMASEEKICHYIDIPLQHIADGVLSRMNRRSTTASIKDTIGRLRTAMPDIHIRTTMIVGFPGETEEEFDELLDFVEETRFERLGVFAYSREEGTVAGDMEDQIDEDVKAQRVDAVMRRQLDISREINEEKVGNTMVVLVDGMDEEGAYLGRTQYDAPEIDNTVIFGSDKELEPGDMVKVYINDAFDYDLVGNMEE